MNVIEPVEAATPEVPEAGDEEDTAAAHHLNRAQFGAYTPRGRNQGVFEIMASTLRRY